MSHNSWSLYDRADFSGAFSGGNKKGTLSDA